MSKEDKNIRCDVEAEISQAVTIDIAQTYKRAIGQGVWCAQDERRSKRGLGAAKDDDECVAGDIAESHVGGIIAVDVAQDRDA